MSFLAPLFLLGGLAVALPILFHLIRRTTRDKVPISSVMFLVPSPPRITRRSRLENLLLLLLRCLVLGLLALGFARPFLQKPMAANPEGAQSRQWVVLVDRSASMQREDLWDQARQRTGEILEQTTAEDRVSLAVFDRRYRTLMSFDQWSATPAPERAAGALDVLADAEPGWAGTRLGDALLAGMEMLEEFESNQAVLGERRIIVVSDLQEGSRIESLQSVDWPDRLTVSLETVSVRQPANVGLQVLPPPRQGPLSAADRLRVRLVNVRESDREQFRLQWRQGQGERAAAKNAASMDVYVPPGQNRIVTIPSLSGEGGAVEMTVTGDDAPFDNTSYHVPLTADQLEVFYLGEDEATDPNQMLFYLNRAFQETSRQVVRVVTAAAGAAPPSDKLKTAKLAIAAGPQSPERLAWLQSLMEAGGTVLFVMRQAGDAEVVGRLAGAEDVRAEEAEVKDYAMLGQVDFTHPLFAPFSDPRYSDFTRISFWRHRRLDTNGLAGARVLWKYDDGDPALLQLPREKGMCFVLTAGWNPRDSQLALSSKFVPLMYTLLEVSGAVIDRPTQLQVGDVVSVTRTNGQAEVAVVRPDGLETNMAAGQPFFGTDVPGIYTLTADEESRLLAVNLVPEESRTSPLEEEALGELGVPLRQGEMTAVQMRKAEETRQMLQAGELENRQKLWRWLIVAAMALLLVESWLAGRLSRRPTAEVAAA